MAWFVAACLAPAFVISLAVTALMRRLAPRWGLIDKPAARKVHTTPTPLGGGLGIYCGFVVPVLVAFAVAQWLARQSPLPDWLPLELRIMLPALLGAQPRDVDAPRSRHAAVRRGTPG